VSTSGGTSGGGSGLPYQTFSGSPVGVVTPTAAGYIGQATDTLALYYATTADSSGWVQMTGPTDYTAAGYAVSSTQGPIAQLTAAATDFVVDDSNGNTLVLVRDTSAGGGIELVDKGGEGVTIWEQGVGPILLTAVGTGSITAGVSGDTLAFLGTTPIAMAAVTGALSTVVDPAAKAVLTAIIAALAPAAGYGLVTDSTT